MDSKDRFLVRTEIRSSSETVVSYGLDLTATSIFVVTEWHAAIDTLVSLRLSFPRILEPVDILARISDIRIAGLPGETGGITLEFDPESGTAIERLASLLKRVNSPPGVLADEKRPCRLLLIEDSTLIRDIFTHGITKFFERRGALAIDHAEDAERAWEMLLGSSYDLVIIDYFLPAEDSASLIARLRRDDRLGHTPVVAISVGGRDAREATLSAGADVFVDKPLVFRDLFNTVRILAETRDDTRPPADRKGILVFDDSPFALALTRVALEAAGFKVAIAANLSSFERQRVTFDPDLILINARAASGSTV